jgi:hypothetical protein
MRFFHNVRAARAPTLLAIRARRSRIRLLLTHPFAAHAAGRPAARAANERASTINQREADAS